MAEITVNQIAGVVVTRRYRRMQLPQNVHVDVPNLKQFDSTEVGSVSLSERFIISGSSLLDDVKLEAPVGFQISAGADYVDKLVLLHDNGMLAEIQIQVRFAPVAPVEHSGLIKISSRGALARNVEVAGTGKTK